MGKLRIGVLHYHGGGCALRDYSEAGDRTRRDHGGAAEFYMIMVR